jgi:hypothetical protein
MNEADRIARERVKREEAERAETARRKAVEDEAEARRLEGAIHVLVPEVLRLLRSQDWRDVESVSVTEYRFPLLGELLGWRTVIKGGWEIAKWQIHPEKGDVHIWLLGDGQFVFNGSRRAVGDLKREHKRMLKGLIDLRTELETAGHAS